MAVILLLVITAFFGLGSNPVRAKDLGIKILTLEEALRIAEEKNKDIQKAKEYRKQVEGRYVEERSAALPQLEATANLTRSRDESLSRLYRGLLSPESSSRNFELGLSQALYTFGRIGAAIRAAKVGLATADDQLRLYRQAARRDVSSAFYDILLAKELHALAVQNWEQKKRHFEEVRRKFDAGVATEYDVLAARVSVENAVPEMIRRENGIRIAKDKLRFLLGLNGQDIDVRGDFKMSPEALPPFEEAFQIALKNRPELADLQKRIEISKELVKIYEAGNLPRLDFRARYGWKDIEQGEVRGDGQYWLAGIFVSFPFFDGLRTQGKVTQARSEMSSLRTDEAKLIDAIALQVREASYACQEAAEIVQALSGTIRQAERLLQMAEKGYEYGVKTKLDVDDAELNLLQAKTNMARAQRDQIVARIQYEWVMGILGEKK